MRFGLGIDTGGTYTDSVILDMDSGMTVCRSKALTTRDDLSKGINESVSGLDRSMLKKVVLVSLSSTLATNSVRALIVNSLPVPALTVSLPL